MSMLLEVEVHSSLRDLLRQQTLTNWVHHLTMARLVARTLRLRNSTLIQTASPSVIYSVSYLIPALLHPDAVVIVAPESIQKRLLEIEIPQLQQWLNNSKPIQQVHNLPIIDRDQGLWLISPEIWLEAQLTNALLFPPHIPTIIDQAEKLPEWTWQVLTTSLYPSDWEELKATFPQQAELILHTKIQLTKAIFNHSINPYEAYLIEEFEQQNLQSLWQQLQPHNQLTSKIANFWLHWLEYGQIMWASIIRETGQFNLHIAPVEIASHLHKIWQKQPLVFISSFLDNDKNALIYRQQIGLDDLLCLQFSPNRQSDNILLYLPDRLPLPNTPQFQSSIIQQLHKLLNLCLEGFIVIIMEDLPLKSQIGAVIAAEFGSRVQVEKTNLTNNNILVTGWNFWLLHQDNLPNPQLLIIVTLPFPSLENPLVAGRVSYYKINRQDWFRDYLLPTALQSIYQAVVSVRKNQGIIALLDSRVNYRSYGNQILTALEPYDKTNYLDASYFLDYPKN